MQPDPVRRRWDGRCVVAATGPSLTPRLAEACHGERVIAVNDAYRFMPFAEVLYACDAAWWDAHDGCPGFAGEKWSSHSQGGNDKLAAAERYGLRLVAGREGEGFSLDPAVIHYGRNSGFQAINLAILFGATRILLLGFDMRVNGKRHFFGAHPPGLKACDYGRFIPHFERAAELMPDELEVINCTPGSALDCFPKSSLEATL